MNPSIKIDIGDDVSVPRPVLSELARRIRRAAVRLKISSESFAGLGVRIVGDKEMSLLHEQFMGEKKPTDVLSFPADSGEGFGGMEFSSGEDSEDDDDSDDAGRVAWEEVLEQSNETIEALGDIVLDWEVICRQASAATDAARLHEATILSVHGLVHLLGHDHRTRREARDMHRLERVALRALRVPDVPRPYTR